MKNGKSGGKRTRESLFLFIIAMGNIFPSFVYWQIIVHCGFTVYMNLNQELQRFRLISHSRYCTEVVDIAVVDTHRE